MSAATDLDAAVSCSRTFTYWRFNTPRMDYTASPDWYAGAV